MCPIIFTCIIWPVVIVRIPVRPTAKVEDFTITVRHRRIGLEKEETPPKLELFPEHKITIIIKI